MTKPFHGEFEDAKKIFFDYNGSRFGMAHDGVDVSYARAEVPSEIEAQWLAELKAEKLCNLDKARNYQTISFLNDQHMFDCDQLLLDTAPKGDLTDRVIYLEELLDYLTQRTTLRSKPIGAVARQKILERARSERVVAGLGEMRERIDALIQKVERAYSPSVADVE
jgi:hypothetical protein